MIMKKCIRFLSKGLFLVLVVSLILTLFSIGYAQQEIPAIRHSNSWAPRLDPGTGTNFLACTLLANIYDTLVFPNTDGSVKPWVAKNWTISEDGINYVFELQPGIKFHNGDELTAEDVVFTMKRLLKMGEGFAYLYLPIVSDTQALDKYKVQFSLKETFPNFLSILVRFYILNKSQVMANISKDGNYGEFGDYGKEWLTTHDAGSGPYKVKQMEIAEGLIMEKFEDYWAGWEENAPHFVHEIGTNEPVTVQTLMARGELEITDQWQSFENLSAMQKLPNTELSSIFEGLILNIMLNTKLPPTDDIHFRKALAYCIDYQTIIDAYSPGARRTGAVSADAPGYNTDLELYEQDLAKAEEELKKSRYYEKLDEFPMEIAYHSTTPEREKIALIVQANAAKLGIKVEILKIPTAAFNDRFSRMEDTPNASIQLLSSVYPEAGGMLHSRYHSTSCGTSEQGEWLQDPEIDKMIEDALSTLDKEERFKKYQAIQAKIHELCPSIWLMEQPTKQIYRSDYVLFPAYEANKRGEACYQYVGYNWYWRDFKVTPESAQPPYTPFIP